MWMCTNSLDAGDKFRDEIVGAVKACKVFVPLINNEWAASGECYDEFSLAKRRNLTSHESGRTSPSGPRLPAIVPVAFPSLDWERFPHVELLAATTNFLLSSTEDVAEDNPVIESVRKCHRLQFVSTLIHHCPPLQNSIATVSRGPSPSPTTMALFVLSLSSMDILGQCVHVQFVSILSVLVCCERAFHSQLQCFLQPFRKLLEFIVFIQLCQLNSTIPRLSRWCGRSCVRCYSTMKVPMLSQLAVA